MTPEEFEAEFSRPSTWRSRRACRKHGFCQTCRGQQHSSVTYQPCPTCEATGRDPNLIPLIRVGWGWGYGKTVYVERHQVPRH